MLTLEMAISKLRQFPPEKQKLVIQFVEYLDREAESVYLEKNQNFLGNLKKSRDLFDVFANS